MRLILLVPLLLSCGEDEGRGKVDAETFLSEYSQAFCEMWAACNPDKLQDLYDGDLTICVEDLEDTQRERIERDGCSYSGTAAGDCLDVLEGMECTNWAEGEGNICGDVIDCS